jgi:hypothetical protein
MIAILERAAERAAQELAVREEWDSKMNQRAHEYIQDAAEKHTGAVLGMLNLHGMCSFWTRQDDAAIPTPCIAAIECITAGKGEILVHIARGPNGLRSVVRLRDSRSGHIQAITRKFGETQPLDAVYNFCFL